MASRSSISRNQKSFTKLQFVWDNYFSGMITDTNDNYPAPNNFKQLINVDTSVLGAIIPRTGYSSTNNAPITFTPNDLYKDDFDKTNFQGVFIYGNEEKNQVFYLIDGLLFDSNGQDLTPNITAWFIFLYDPTTTNPNRQLQFSTKKFTFKDYSVRLSRDKKLFRSSNYQQKMYIPISFNKDISYPDDTSITYKFNNYILQYDGVNWFFDLPTVPDPKEVELLGFNNLVYSSFKETNIFANPNPNDIQRKLSYYIPNTEGLIISKNIAPTTSTLPKAFDTSDAQVLNILRYPLEPIQLENIATGTNDIVINDWDSSKNTTSVISSKEGVDSVEIGNVTVDRFSNTNITSAPFIRISYTLSDGTTQDLIPYQDDSGTFNNVFEEANEGTLLYSLYTDDFNFVNNNVLMKTLEKNNGLSKIKNYKLINNASIPYTNTFSVLSNDLNTALLALIQKCQSENLVFNNFKMLFTLNTDWVETDLTKFYDFSNDLNILLKSLSNLTDFHVLGDFYLNFELVVDWDGADLAQTYHFTTTNVQFLFNGTFEGKYIINKSNDKFMYFKAHIATSGTLPYETIDSRGKVNDDNDNQYTTLCRWFWYPIDNADTIWNQPYLFEDPAATDPKDLTSLPPQIPKTENWIPIKDFPDSPVEPLDVTNSSSIIRFWESDKLFLLAVQIIAVDSDDNIEKTFGSYYKVIQVEDETKDYFIDFEQLALCNNSKVINGYLFVWNSTLIDASKNNNFKNNRFFFSQKNDFNYFPSDNYVDLDIQQDETILNILPFQNSYIIITTNSLFLLQGDNIPFKITLINKGIQVLNETCALSYTNYIYFADEEGIWQVSNDRVAVNDRSNLVELTKPIKNGVYRGLDKSECIAIANGDILMWFFPKSKTCLKLYTTATANNKFPTWSIDTSDIFADIKFITRPLLPKLFTYNSDNQVVVYDKTQLSDRIFIDGDTNTNGKTYPYQVKMSSLNQYFGNPLNFKKYRDFAWSFGLDSESTAIDLENLQKLKIKLQIYVDDNLTYGSDKYNVGLNGQLIVDEQSNYKEISQGLIANNPNETLGTTSPNKQTSIKRGLKINSKGYKIRYDMIIDDVGYFLVENLLIVYSLRNAKLSNFQKIS